MQGIRWFVGVSLNKRVSKCPRQEMGARFEKKRNTSKLLTGRREAVMGTDLLFMPNGRFFRSIWLVGICTGSYTIIPEDVDDQK
jgi:hypothetical protein